MAISDLLSNLLRELHRLYDQIALAQLHKRMDGYHRSTEHSQKPHASDIRTSLLEYVDNVVVVEKEKIDMPNEASAHAKESAAIDKPAVRSSHTSYPFNFEKKTVGPNPYKLNKEQVSDLTKYFKLRSKNSELHPAIKEKLKSSVWDHINASVQCALKGDKRNAKMHADIANYAFKEIAHYMPAEQYLELSGKIKRRIDELKVD